MIKTCGFDDDAFGRCFDLRIITAHDSAKANRFRFGSNHDIVRQHFIFIPIKSGISGMQTIYNCDLLCRDRVDIIEMHRLPGFQHDDIGNVHDIVN